MAKRRSPKIIWQTLRAFIESKANDIPALITVVTRPRDLTRRQLRELLLELDNAGFSEASLSAAWKQMTNQEIAARIVGYIRQAALGRSAHTFRTACRSRTSNDAFIASGQIPSVSGCRRLLLKRKPTCVWTARRWTSRPLFSNAKAVVSPVLTSFSRASSRRFLTQFNDVLWPQSA